MDGSKVMKGNLYSADKDGIKIIKGEPFDVSNLVSIEAKQIEKIKIRRKGQIGRGVWIGALTGASVGVIAGFVSGDDEPGFFSATKEEKALGAGITFGVLGSGIGALIGTGKKKIILNGDPENYKNQLKTIQRYALMINDEPEFD